MIDTESYHATIAIDRRSDDDQSNNKTVIIGLNDYSGSNKLAKIITDENNDIKHFISEELFVNDEASDERLFKGMILSNTRLLTFRPQVACIHDMSSLQSIHKISWNDFLEVRVE